MDSTPFDSLRIVSLSPLSPLALAALCAAVVAGVGLAAWGVRAEAHRGRRAALWGLRLLAGVCALFFLFEPGLRKVQVARVKNRVAVLVDRSASMQFPSDVGGPTRTELVARALDSLSGPMEALKDRYAFEVYGFDPELSPTSADGLRREAARANRTDLATALRTVKAGESGSGRKLSGVIVFSDGADNTELAQGLTGRLKQSLEGFGAPVSTVAVGAGNLNDLSIDSVKVDDFAFVRNSVTVEAEVRGRGFRDQTVQVVLRREGQVVGTKSVRFEADDGVQPVSFTFTPDQTGRFVYTLSVPVFLQEAVVENNRRSFALKVIRDRVRVLLVAGRPSWDERFLRGLLKQDANVELISFYILRNSADEPGTFDDKELSLIPFPSEEIFQTKINTFDVVLILNWHEERNITLATYERDIKAYVLNGGALAYVGGDRAFGESPGAFNPFGEVLPLEAAGPAEVRAFKPRLTAEGQRHPVMNVGGGALSAEAAMAALPQLGGINRTRLKPGAVALVDHPFTTVGTANAPVVALWDFGRGRAMGIATDELWRWAFGAQARGQQSRVYERFWNNALRWLVRDPDLTTLSLSADAPAIEPGLPVGLSLSVRTPDYQPAPGAEVQVELTSADDGKTIGKQTAVAGPDGSLRVEFPAPPAGAYKVAARATKDGKPLGEATDAVAVRAAGSERSDARVNARLLADIARATGGKAFESTSFSLSDVPLAEPPLVEVGRSRDQPLWDRWYWLTLMVFVVGAEWAIRRRFGYV